MSSGRTAVVLDAQPLMLAALDQILAGLEIDVVADASTASAALEAVVEHHPSLLVADLGSRDVDLDVYACMRGARSAVEGLRVVALVQHAHAADLKQAFESGADAFVVKTAEPEDIAAAVRQVFSRSLFFPGAMDVQRRAAAAATSSASSELLTRRELEILRLVADGHSNSELAQMLWVTEQTVKFHLSNVYRKLHVANRTEASRWAHVHGILTAVGSDPRAHHL